MLVIKPVTLLLPGLGLDVVTPTLRAIVTFCDLIFITSRALPNKTTSPALGSALKKRHRNRNDTAFRPKSFTLFNLQSKK